MEHQKNIAVALIRGDSLNPWEGKMWDSLPGNFSVTGIAAKKNLYPIETIGYPIIQLPTSTDTRLTSAIDRYFFSGLQTMIGLEKSLLGFDIAHSAEIYFSYTLQAVRAKKKYPHLKVVASVSDNSFGRFEFHYTPPLAHPPGWWKRKMYKHIAEVVSGIDMLLPISETSASLLRSYEVPEHKMTVLPPGLLPPTPVTSFSPELESLRSSGKKIIMVVNRMVKEKGIYDVLFAWQMLGLQGKLHDKHLVIVGSGPETVYVHQLLKDWNLIHTVTHISQLPNNEVRSFYKYAHCFILASVPSLVWQEQFGYVLVEAMMNGCPIIATRSGSIPGVVGDAAILVNPMSPGDIAEAILSYDNKNIRERVVQAGIARAPMYSAEVFRTKLVQIYHSLIS